MLMFLLIGCVFLIYFVLFQINNESYCAVQGYLNATGNRNAKTHGIKHSNITAFLKLLHL